MAVNKVIYNNNTLIDISDTTAVASDVASGKVFYAADGTETIGTASGGGGVTVEALSVTQNGTYTAPSGSAYSPVMVNVSGGGGSEDVFFIDYDGTVLHTYSAAEFAALSALPSNPSHTGLTAQGWNWTLADAKTQVASSGNLVIGQNYVTSDGKTRFYIEIPEGTDETKRKFYIYCKQSVSNGVVFDWGDGSATETYTGTNVSNRNHLYASAGSYVITLEVTSGSLTFGQVSSGYRIYGTATLASYIRRVEIGSNIVFDVRALIYCYRLETITIPNYLTTVSNERVFQACYSLKSITIPNSTTSIGIYAFNDCDLQSMSIPKTVTSIGNYGMYSNRRLELLSIPDGVTSIGENALYQYCGRVKINIKNCTTIAKGAFQFCYNVSELNMPNNVNYTTINEAVFNSWFGLTSLSIPNNVTSIGKAAFQNCAKLSSVTFSNKLTSIGETAFNNCTILNEFELPNTLTSIEKSAFSYCYSFARLEIPASVTSIGNTAFSNCSSLIVVRFLGDEPPVCGTSIFGNAFTGVIYVPYSADHSILDAYKVETNLSIYASKMQEEPQ